MSSFFPELLSIISCPNAPYNFVFGSINVKVPMPLIESFTYKPVLYTPSFCFTNFKVEEISVLFLINVIFILFLSSIFSIFDTISEIFLTSISLILVITSPTFKFASRPG